MALIAAGFVGYVLGCAAMVVVFVLDQQREDMRWICWRPKHTTDKTTALPGGSQG